MGLLEVEFDKETKKVLSVVYRPPLETERPKTEIKEEIERALKGCPYLDRVDQKEN